MKWLVPIKNESNTSFLSSLNNKYKIFLSSLLKHTSYQLLLCICSSNSMKNKCLSFTKLDHICNRGTNSFPWSFSKLLKYLLASNFISTNAHLRKVVISFVLNRFSNCSYRESPLGSAFLLSQGMNITFYLSLYKAIY